MEILDPNNFPELIGELDGMVADFRFDNISPKRHAVDVAHAVSAARLLELSSTPGGVDMAMDDSYYVRLNSPSHLTRHLVGKVRVTGNFWYPPGGYMGWHTNGNDPGVRLYATWAKEGYKSFFRYATAGAIVTSYDAEGWNFRQFTVDRQRPFWHCVYSDTHRVSFGFNLIGGAAHVDVRRLHPARPG